MPNNESHPMAERMASMETEMRLHAAECVSYRLETRDQMRSLLADMQTLLKQSAIAEGRAEVNKRLFGNIPNTFWSVVIAGIVAAAGSGLTIFWLRIVEPIKVVTGH
jgi:hypothetical protein